jgi:hypothetical protein
MNDWESLDQKSDGWLSIAVFVGAVIMVVVFWGQ